MQVMASDEQTFRPTKAPGGANKSAKIIRVFGGSVAKFWGLSLVG